MSTAKVRHRRARRARKAIAKTFEPIFCDFETLERWTFKRATAPVYPRPSFAAAATGRCFCDFPAPGGMRLADIELAEEQLGHAAQVLADWHAL